MGLLTINHWQITNHASTIHLLSPVSTLFCAKFNCLRSGVKSQNALKFSIKAFASRKSVKKLKRDEQLRLTKETNVVANGSTAEDDYVKDGSQVSSVDDFAPQKLATFPSRSSVLQACTVTCGILATLGLIIRQAWPDFAESSEAANQQVLTSLEPLDYLVVAFLPGVSEELLFRGALLPLFGTNWTSVLVVATIFGVLHLGNGRKYSFAVWATFVGFLYAYATIVSNSVIVPMASHSLNNLVGGILWRYTSKTSNSK